ncbi:MAG: prepilin-type N-terminal cleavage/methylation domain-containing protein [Phycisphaerales bacterium]|nr:prepilin-type N-terminal cleavage/methylation domain-containing protein [Phycisphaerales bacterium]
MNTRPSQHGFTLIETVVASIIGAVVLLGCFSVFAATGRMDRAFANRFEHSNELYITQLTMRRAFLTLQMSDNVAVTVEETDEDGEPEPQPRERIILELDHSAGEDSKRWMPQRFEVVLSTPPIAMSLASASAGWVRLLDQDESLDFSSPEGTGGAMRSVFELRRTDAREDIMFRNGLIDSGIYALMTGHDPDLGNDQLTENTPAEGWSLWWRPILTAEGNALDAGYSPMRDTEGSTEQIRTRLAGAIRVAQGIDRARWQLFKGDVMIDQFRGSTMLDLPAYAQFEVKMIGGQYATWMFEVDWVIGDDPNDGQDGGGAGGEGTDNTDGGSGGGNNRPGGNNNRPGTGGSNPNIDLGGSIRDGNRGRDEN